LYPYSETRELTRHVQPRRGVPLRIEFGPKDAANDVVSYARRDTGEKGTIPVAELATKVPELLEEIQKALYDKADAAFSSHRLVLTDWSKVVPALDSKNVVLIPFCEAPACEERIKEITKSEEPKEGAQNEKQPSMGMKSLCIPFDQVRTQLPLGLLRIKLTQHPTSPRASLRRPNV
jgi:prolyl-tRNA synthetase